MNAASEKDHVDVLISKIALNSFEIVYKKTDEWYIEWKRVVQRVTTNDSEWQQITTSGKTSENEWYNKWQGMTTSGQFC